MKELGSWFAVVIPFHHRRDLLDPLLGDLRSYRVIVVDDGPVKSVFSEGVEVIRTSGQEGFSRAINCGLGYAQERGITHVLLLNDDARPQEGCVEVLLNSIDDQCGAVGAVLNDDHRVTSAGIQVLSWGRIRSLKGVPTDKISVDALCGACMLIPAAIRMDERFTHGFEDIELCLRLRSQGLDIQLNPMAKCWHEGGGSLSRTSRRAQRSAVYGHLLLMEHGKFLPVVAGLAILQVLRERGPACRLAGIWDGIRDWIRATSLQA